MQNRRGPRSNRYWARRFYWVSAIFALVGVAWIVYAGVFDASWTYFLLSGVWLVLAACLVPQARQYGRRERLGFDLALPAAGQDVHTLLRQGRKIEAIKRYRELNPGIGLREAKHVVDGLEPGLDDPGMSGA